MEISRYPTARPISPIPYIALSNAGLLGISSTISLIVSVIPFIHLAILLRTSDNILHSIAIISETISCPEYRAKYVLVLPTYRANPASHFLRKYLRTATKCYPFLRSHGSVHELPLSVLRSVVRWGDKELFLPSWFTPLTYFSVSFKIFRAHCFACLALSGILLATFDTTSLNFIMNWMYFSPPHPQFCQQ